MATPKELAENSEVSLVVSDDSHEGDAASVVLFDKTGQVHEHMVTTVGEGT